MESLHLGHDMFIPFLEQNTELTPEDEKRLDEIMATEDDWFHRAKEPAEEEAQEYTDTLNSAEHITELFTAKDAERKAQQDFTETVAKYPAVENGLPYDIVVEKIRFDEPEHGQPRKTPVTAEPSAPPLSADRHNYRIADDNLGIGGAKEKFRNNMSAIRLLHDLQIGNRFAAPEEQETLARYVGWGGLSMVFDGSNAAWANEYKELKSALSDEE